MLKWFLIIFVGIIVVIAALLGTLYYLIFVQDVALTRPEVFAYDSEEEAVAAGLSDMINGLLGIELTEAQVTELEEIIGGLDDDDGTTFDDLIDFITNPDTGVIAVNPISLTGQRSLQLNDTTLTALINLMVGSVDAFFTADGVSSESGALIYTVEGIGDLKLSGIGININETDIEIVCAVTLPQDIPYAGFIVGGRTISIGLNPLIEVEEDGTINIDFNLEGLRIGGISASWPGVSNLVSYVESSFLSEDMLTQSFNITGPLNDALGTDLGLSFEVAQGTMSFTGPAPLSAAMEIFDFTEEELADLVASADAAIDAFATGASDTLVLSEEEITAVLSDNIETALEGEVDLGIDLEDFSVNVEEDGVLAMTSTVTVPEGTDLGIPEGSEIEVGLLTEVVIVDGEPTLEITGFDLGGLPDETLSELGLDQDTLNESLADSGIDLSEALGLDPGSLAGTTTDDEGNLILTGS